MDKIRPVLEGIYKVPKLRRTIVPNFMGAPGLGKTFIINEFVEFAKENKVKFVDFFGTAEILDPVLVEYIASQVSPLEVSGIGMPDKDTKQMVYYNFNKLANLKNGDILFFDELPNANPSVFNSLLTLIEGRRMMSGDKLPDIMIVAAGNWQGMSPMTPQIKRRFVWYDVKFNSKMWQDWMFKTYLMPDVVSYKLLSLIRNEKFEGFNFYTPADIAKAVDMMIYDVPTPYETELKHILETFITNDLGEILNDKGEIILTKNEKMSWLNLIKLIKSNEKEIS